MYTLAIEEVLRQLLLSEIKESLADFLQPIMERLPDKRLGRVVPLVCKGYWAVNRQSCCKWRRQSPAVPVKHGP